MYTYTHLREGRCLSHTHTTRPLGPGQCEWVSHTINVQVCCSCYMQCCQAWVAGEWETKHSVHHSRTSSPQHTRFCVVLEASRSPCAWYCLCGSSRQGSCAGPHTTLAHSSHKLSCSPCQRRKRSCTPLHVLNQVHPTSKSAHGEQAACWEGPLRDLARETSIRAAHGPSASSSAPRPCRLLQAGRSTGQRRSVKARREVRLEERQVERSSTPHGRFVLQSGRSPVRGACGLRHSRRPNSPKAPSSELGGRSAPSAAHTTSGRRCGYDGLSAVWVDAADGTEAVRECGLVCWAGIIVPLATFAPK